MNDINKQIKLNIVIGLVTDYSLKLMDIHSITTKELSKIMYDIAVLLQEESKL